MTRFLGNKRALAFVSVLMILMLAVTACGGGTSGSESGGDPAPDFKATLFTGEEFQLSVLQGSPVVVNFWFPSCPPCRAEIPDLEAAWLKYKDQGFTLIGIQLLGLDTEEDGKKFIEDIGVTYPIAADRDASITQDYEVAGFPSTYFINRYGGIEKKWAGLLDAETLESYIEEIL